MLKTGKTYRSVADSLSASLSSIVRWHKTHQQKGLKGLKPKPTPGRPSRLSDSQKQKLKQLLIKGHQATGSPANHKAVGALWTLKRIRVLIKKRFGVSYHTGHIWKILKGRSP